MYSHLSKATRTAIAHPAAVGILILIVSCGFACAQRKVQGQVAAPQAKPDGPRPKVPSSQPGRITLQRPDQGEFILDQAGLLQPEDKKKITQIADKLLRNQGTPILVVTVGRMAEHGGADMRIETFARLLFDQWQIGQLPQNKGILLLVAKGDRKARIELGAGWERDRDPESQWILDELIIPHFKREKYSAGIVVGVQALDAMARGLELPGRSRAL